MWDEGFPYRSVRYGIIASSTRGSRGVVEIWSKKIGANGDPSYSFTWNSVILSRMSLM